MGDFDAAEEELPPGDELVDVPAVSDRHQLGNITTEGALRH
jgi:hypothetical protein